MFFILLGMAAGVVVAFGAVPLVAPTAEATATGAVDAGIRLLDKALISLGVDLEGTLAVVLRSCSVALMPGVVAGLLLGAARGSVFVRRMGSLVVVAGAVFVATSQPAPYGIVGAIVLLSVGLSLAFVASSAVAVVASGVSGLLAATQLRLFLDDDANRFSDTAATLADAAGAGDPSLWRLVLVLSSATVAASVFWYALHDTPRSAR